MANIPVIIKSKPEKKDIPIKYYRQEFKDKERILDDWQRLDGWNGKDRGYYKADFISSIINGDDVPKIMEYTLLGDELQKKRILDGGHRTRCIDEFMDGKFPVYIDGNYYYWKMNENTPKRKGDGHNLVLPDSIKKDFSDYTLTVTTYPNITEEDARKKFNDLNHCRPMEVCEVINSHSSILVDLMRKEWSFVNKPGTGEVSNEDECLKIKEIFSLSDKDLEKLKYMKTMVSLFSLIERNKTGEQFKYCEPKNALKYIRSNEYDGLNTQFSKEEVIVEWGKFTDAIEKYKEWIHTFMEDNGGNFKYKPSNHSETLSLFHWINNKGELSQNTNTCLKEFFEKCYNYKKEASKFEKALKNVKGKDMEVIREANNNIKNLEENVGEDVVKWVNSFKNNGAGESNLKKRYMILNKIN